MNLSHLLSFLKKLPQFNTIVKNIINGVKKQSVCGLFGSSKTYFLAGLKKEVHNPFFIILPDRIQAEKMYTELEVFAKDTNVLFLPDLEILPYDKILPHKGLVGQRFAALDGLSNQQDIIIVSFLRSILFKVPSPTTLSKAKIFLQTSNEISPTLLLNKLTQLGYSPDEVVESKGTFSRRGGIVDIYPVNTEFPVRIEFFGDVIESIRQFDIITQRSISFIDHITIFPVQEDILLKGEVSSVFDYLPSSSLVILNDIAYLENETRRIEEEVFSLYERAKVFAEQKIPSPEEFLINWEELQSKIYSKQLLCFEDEGIEFLTKPVAGFKNSIKLFINELKKWQEEENKIIIVASYKGQEERIKELLRDNNMDLEGLTITSTSGNLKQGFQFTELRLVVITDSEIFGYPSYIFTRRFDHLDTLPISTFTDLKVGDYVVHINYGIGKYGGITTVEVEGIKKDFMVIEYAEGDKLYIPLDQFSLVEKYIGDKDKPPKIYRLNDTSWSAVKKRVKKSIESMAKELIELYAARKALPGYAFSKDTEWQYEFEAGFVYEETPDQLKAILEVKEDMMKPQPMDRLICGDVGYGKTEVALRAAFKAVMDNKQVAILVPTTILAFQHYNTFVSRFAPFPVKIEMLSRFRTKAQQRKIIEGLKTGEIDICIGTHRLLQKDVEFRDLSLVIIDEEHKFGVRHKERLKQIRKLVDVLTLTATPIPRTLYMALSGARDMSIINTPPPERLPIKTFVLPFSKEVIREAILREMSREGQIYFVHTEVKTISVIYNLLKEIVPEARITVAHGQMSEHELEKVMLKFLGNEYDILLSTSIIESGIDIPRVNTIIINNAHQFGLSQLYQLRGRVGRSNHMAYAYLLYPHKSALSSLAKERLDAIREFSDLGAGFKLAMRDLEIRGAGNILGPEQHGNLVAVGFDLYCKLLQEAVAKLKGEEIVDDSLPPVDLPCDTYIPEEYIPDTTQRYTIYKKLSKALDFDTLQKLEEEIADRYGKIPLPVRRLLELLNMRLMAKRVGITSLSFADGCLIIELPFEEKLIPKVISLLSLFPERLKLNPKRTNCLIMKWTSDDESVYFLKEILQALQ